MLGVEDILRGIDHLLFVLALLFLVSSRSRLIGTITAFTLAHSMTLVAATLEWIHVPQAPVEAARDTASNAAGIEGKGPLEKRGDDGGLARKAA